MCDNMKGISFLVRLMKLKIAIFSIGFITSMTLSSCITTVEDVAGQYDIRGPVEFAQWYADDFSTDSLWNKAIEDSIMPLILALPFDDIAQIGAIIKETPAFKLLSASAIDKDKMMGSFRNRNFKECAEFYAKYYSVFPELTSVYCDSILKNADKESFDQIAETGVIVNKSPALKPLIGMSFERGKIMESFYARDLDEGVNFYIKYHRIFPMMDSIFTDSIIPIAESAPYPILENIAKKLSAKNIKFVDDSILTASKYSYLSEIRDEIFECKMNSIEIYDQIVSASIELELDSLSNESLRKVIDKFSGGILDYRRLLVVFGRDESKFKELWQEYIDGEDYTDIFYRHISSMLRDMYQLQLEYYNAFTGRELQIEPKMVDPKKINIEFPDGELAHIKEFIGKEKTTGLVNAASNAFSLTSLSSDPRFFALQIIVEAGTDLADVIISEPEELDSNDELVAYCQYAILAQIPENYREDLRNQVLMLINNSYDNLYNNIADAI